jgi:hypothetical protein
MTHEQAVQELFTDWIDAAAYVISETSGDIERDTRALLERGRRRCDALGITFGLWLIPEHINDAVDRWDQYQQEVTP